ncbi:unnamed protein product [Cylicostephanus goldi]|uniref:PIN domain-containing protein n=1 Tax=Cylicostephanus goldi TaxID=71465 RepID=A0A3P7MFZ8_CYLGO|nr:unnamed protein product [Cylicostephanus goldi]
MGGPTAGTVDCSVGVIVPESPNPELDELRELRSSKLEKKDLPQSASMVSRVPIHWRRYHPLITSDCAEVDHMEMYSGVDLLAQQAMHCLKKSSMSQHLIFEDSSESLNEVNGFKVARNNNDDLILRCAFKIQVNLPADCVDSRIFFITDDCNLSLKARAHNVKYMTAKEYLVELQKSGLNITRAILGPLKLFDPLRGQFIELTNIEDEVDQAVSGQSLHYSFVTSSLVSSLN